MLSATGRTRSSTSRRKSAGHGRLVLIAVVLAPLGCVPDAPEATGPTGVADLPAPPQDLRVTDVDSTRIELEWSAPAEGDEARLFRIYRSGARLDSTSSTAFSDRDLEPFTIYEYSVATMEDGREGDPSPPVEVRTLDGSPPSSPEDLEADGSRSRVELEWSAAGDPESGVDHYRIYRREGREGDREEIGTTDSTSFSDTEVRAFTVYRYTVSAVNGDELEGDESDGADAWTFR